MKTWEKNYRKETSISKKQFSLMSGRLMMELIFCAGQIVKNYKKKNPCMAYRNLDKAYDTSAEKGSKVNRQT